jgi:ribonuclease-3
LRERIESLQARLGYRFRQPELLEQAITHRSAGGTNNERLEFLGDAVLGMVIAEALYHRFPLASEGELSRLRATLVRKPTLAEIARSLELGEHLKLGAGELKSGGFRRDSILSDALEAVLGAIYLDDGLDPCRDWVQDRFASRLASLPAAAELKDYKTRLQEFLQSRQLALPEYVVIGVRGQAHAQTFEVECRVAERDTSTRGMGTSRRNAEQQAAGEMLKVLGIDR